MTAYVDSSGDRSPVATSSGEDKATEEEALADLAAHIEDLRIVIHDLDVSKPALTPGLFGVVLSFLLLIGAIALVVAPYFEPRIPLTVSNVGAFLVVIFAFALYLAFRTLSAEFERRRLHVSVYQRAFCIDQAAKDLLESADADEFVSKVVKEHGK